MELKIHVTDCRDCPVRKSHRGHGECWEHCSHPDTDVPLYARILWGCREEFESTPSWCPLRKTLKQQANS